jgi:sugar phosphate isomerase/epimerase
LAAFGRRAWPSFCARCEWPARDEYLAALGGKLLHVHLSENDGSSDQHLLPGSAPRSSTDWPEHFRKLKATGYDGTITLEGQWRRPSEPLFRDQGSDLLSERRDSFFNRRSRHG